MSTLLERLDSNKVFGGQLIKYKFKVCKSGQKRYHRSSSIQSTALGGLDALFNLFLPVNTTQGKVPVLIYLSGLTCTEDNGYVKCSRSDLELLFFLIRAQKGGFLAVASSQGIAMLFPDTSPRGARVPGEDDDWDFGTGAGFYLDATKPEYTKCYNMATHIAVELPQVIEAAGLPVVRPYLSIRCQRY